MPLKARMGELLILGKAWTAKPLFRNFLRRVDFVSTPRSQPKKPDIIVNRKLVWTRGYGFADRERAVPFTQDTIMNIGSISKTITGAALMRAVQEGKLSLDGNINKYLPFKVANPSFPNEPITLRQLATHTSRVQVERMDRPDGYSSPFFTWAKERPASSGLGDRPNSQEHLLHSPLNGSQLRGADYLCALV